MYGNPALDCSGAQMRALCRQLATVVTVSGEVNESNLDHISAYAQRFVLTEKPFVLDLTGVNSFSPECISLLYAIDENCRPRRRGLVGRPQPTGPPDTAVVRRARDVPDRRAPSPRRFTTSPTASANAAAFFLYSPRPPNRKGDHVLIDLRWLTYLLHGRHTPARTACALVRRIVARRAGTARARRRTVSGIDNSGGGAGSAHRPPEAHRAWPSWPAGLSGWPR